MRTLAPAETLVYLETNDLGAALQPIVDSKPFTDVAKSKPDFSALKGVQLAVAVTGFETSEEKLTDEHSVGRVQPHFVAIADTHAWNYQANAFAEKKLGGFVEEIYDSQPTLEKSDKNGGKYLTWTAKDGRRAYALVIDSLIYFGNDETSIDKCLAVKRGEADSLAKAGKVRPGDPATLASGYVGPDGIAQIANIVGLKFASEAADESEVQSAIAGILPQLLRNSITEICWTATKTKEGIEDKYLVTMPTDIANVFNETMASGGHADSTAFNWLPSDVSTATRYDFKDTQIAWRSLLLVIQKKLDPSAANALVAFSRLFFEPYGISDPDIFFSAGVNVATANFSAEGDKPVLRTNFIDEGKFHNSLLKDLRVQRSDGSRHTDDEDIRAFQIGVTMVSGEGEAVKSLYPFYVANDKKNTLADSIPADLGKDAVVFTVGHDTVTTLSLVDILAHEGHGDTKSVSTYFTETRFTKSGMERKTTSDFGLIGSIIAALAQD
ncbi:MAG: hypothetical protein ACKVQJ_10070 [Pyrinomonadaceae bacterium]